ncbi:hypothetical protein IKF81_00635 [Candidatus Saccharibacteria bacterium]|nr:hypothetical protein [Candidatus Saccharibacteria bacterium]
MSIIDVLIILPRRHAVFIPALSEIDRYYYRPDKKNYEEVRYQLAGFINYLVHKSEELAFADKKEIEWLRRDAGKLLYMYCCGQRISEWDFELMTEGEYIARAEAWREKDRSVDWKKVEAWKESFFKRQKSYRRLALIYLQDKRSQIHSRRRVDGI